MYMYIYVNLYIYIYICIYIYIFKYKKVTNDNKPTKAYNGLEVQALYDASNLGGLQWSDPKGLQCNEKPFQTLATVWGTPPPF